MSLSTRAASALKKWIWGDEREILPPLVDADEFEVRGSPAASSVARRSWKHLLPLPHTRVEEIGMDHLDQPFPTIS